MLYFFYTLQFAEWWLAHADQLMAQEIPEPPAQSIAVPTAADENKSSSSAATAAISKRMAAPGKCPLCKTDFTNPTVVTMTGVVYCYRCIHAYIERQCKCYVTGMPVESTSVLRRIFDQ